MCLLEITYMVYITFLLGNSDLKFETHCSMPSLFSHTEIFSQWFDQNAALAFGFFDSTPLHLSCIIPITRQSFLPLYTWTILPNSTRLNNFFFSFATLWHMEFGIWSSWARGQIWGAVGIYATSVAMPDLLTHWAGLGIKPESCHCRDALNPLVPQRELSGLVFHVFLFQKYLLATLV